MECFVTVSANLEHGAPEIWSHLKPVLLEISDNQKIYRLKITSDRPTSQYQNCYNFFLVYNLVPELYPNDKRCIWNFTETAHGKGPKVEVGGVLKIAAYSCVSYKSDVDAVDKFCGIVEREISQCKFEKNVIQKTLRN